MDDRRAQKKGLLMVLLNAYATPLMLSASNVALPNIARDLGLDAVVLSWIPTVYLMASAIFIPVFGALADIYGCKRFFLSGIISIILTSALAATAVNGLMLVSARFLQGISAAMLYATQIAIVSALFPPERRGRIIGLTLSVTYIGLASGPLLGGVLTDIFGWRASFLLHIPLLLFALLIVPFTPRVWSRPKQAQFDGGIALLYCTAIMFLCIGVAYLPNLVAILFFGTGMLLIVSFFRHTRQAPQPLFDVNLFYTNRIFCYSCLTALLVYAASYANIVLISLYLQYIKVMSATTAGLILLTQPLIMALFSPIAGHLSDRFEPKIIASAGLLSIVVGLLMLALLDAASSFFSVLGALMITGLGLGLFTSPNTNAIMATVRPDYYGRAASAASLVRILGQMVSMLLVTLVFRLMIGANEVGINNEALLQAIKISFVIAVLLCVLSLFFSLQRGQMHNDEAV